MSFMFALEPILEKVREADLKAEEERHKFEREAHAKLKAENAAQGRFTVTGLLEKMSGEAVEQGKNIEAPKPEVKEVPRGKFPPPPGLK